MASNVRRLHKNNKKIQRFTLHTIHSLGITYWGLIGDLLGVAYWGLIGDFLRTYCGRAAAYWGFIGGGPPLDTYRPPRLGPGGRGPGEPKQRAWGAGGTWG